MRAESFHNTGYTGMQLALNGVYSAFDCWKEFLTAKSSLRSAKWIVTTNPYIDASTNVPKRSWNPYFRLDKRQAYRVKLIVTIPINA
jgi:hypothetical protein